MKIAYLITAFANFTDINRFIDCVRNVELPSKLIENPKFQLIGFYIFEELESLKIVKLNHYKKEVYA